MTTLRQSRPGPVNLHCKACSLRSTCLTRSLSQAALGAFDVEAP